MGRDTEVADCPHDLELAADHLHFVANQNQDDRPVSASREPASPKTRNHDPEQNPKQWDQQHAHYPVRFALKCEAQESLSHADQSSLESARSASASLMSRAPGRHDRTDCRPRRLLLHCEPATHLKLA